jgi:hypothetical protein
LLAALGWWWLVFRPIVGTGYLSLHESVACAGFGSTICDLVMSLCKADHPLGIRWYSPALLWSASATLFVALFLAARQCDQR